MKIVSKIKDFYDYLVGKWGQDDKIVYVREGERLVNNNVYKASIADESCLQYWGDTKLYERIKISNKRKHTGTEIVVLWVGDECFKHVVTVSYDENDKLVSQWVKVEKSKYMFIDFSGLKRESEAPVVWEVRSDFRFRLLERVENPNLTGTKYASMLDPEKVWLAIYSYISRNYEKKIVDNRTNDEKIECNGFDKKTSFRNVK